jgi:hypothetical protein
MSSLGKILGTVVGGAGGFLLGGPAGALTGASLGGGLAGGAGAQGKANKLTKQQLDLALQRYQEGAPFRSKLAALANNLPTQREDTSALFADPGNVYSRVIPRPAPPAQGGGKFGAGLFELLRRSNPQGLAATPTTATPIAPVRPRSALAADFEDRSKLARRGLR